MGFDFSEDAITRMYAIYEDTLDYIDKSTNKIAQELVAKAKQTRYEPAVKATMQAVDYYNNELKSAETAAFRAWQQSSASFYNVKEHMRAGEMAGNRCRRLEAQIEERLNQWGHVDSSQLRGIDTTNWKCTSKDFDELSGIISAHLTAMRNHYDARKSELSRAEGENQIYVSISPVVMQSISIVIAGFENGIRPSFLDIGQTFERKQREVSNLGSDTAYNTQSRSESFVESGASSLRAKVKNILD